MAIFHCQIKIISRGKGKTATAAAAYRSGTKIVDDEFGETHDYTRKGGVYRKLKNKKMLNCAEKLKLLCR